MRFVVSIVPAKGTRGKVAMLSQKRVLLKLDSYSQGVRSISSFPHPGPMGTSAWA